MGMWDTSEKDTGITEINSAQDFKKICSQSKTKNVYEAAYVAPWNLKDITIDVYSPEWNRWGLRERPREQQPQTFLRRVKFPFSRTFRNYQIFLFFACLMDLAQKLKLNPLKIVYQC